MRPLILSWGQQPNALIHRGLFAESWINNEKRPRVQEKGCAWIVPYPSVFLASADVRFFKQVTCPVWSKDKITQK
jgi:hypothetical protein